MSFTRSLLLLFCCVFLTMAAAPSARSQCPGVTHFQFTDNTEEFYAIVLQDGGSPCGPQLCDEIGVFDGELCVGATVFEGNWPVAIAAWKDDTQTGGVVDGFIAGHQMSFRIWRHDSDTEEETNPKYSAGDGTFGSGFFSQLTFGPAHFTFAANTGDSYSIVIEEGSTLCDLQPCDEIAVFDGNLCVGATIFEGAYPFALAAWEDDSQTAGVDGYTVGHQMTFRVWRSADDLEEPAEPHITVGSANFKGSAFTSLWLECVCDNDTEPPTIDFCPGDIAIDCAASIEPANTGTPLASDYCDADPALTYEDGSISNFSFTRTWIATDLAGNSDTCYQVVTLVDTTDPTIVTCPDDYTVDCASLADPSETGQPTATDNCDASPILTHLDGLKVNDTLVRAWTITDAAGNSATCEQLIAFIDTTKPEITLCPPNITIDCASSTSPTVTGQPTVVDNCDQSPAVTWFDGPTVNWSFTRSWTVTDASGNSANCSQVITIDDTEDPQITCPASISVQCSDSVPPPNLGLPVVSDNCDNDLTVTYLGDVSDGQSCPETITRTYQATDDHDNSATCQQTITVMDTRPPVFNQACPTNVTVECDAVPAPAVLSATDNCVLSPTVVFSADTVDGNCDNEYVITRTWTATDDCDNVATCTQVVTVQDTQAPVFDQTGPASKIVECDAIPAAATMTASDFCDATPQVTFNENTTPGGCDHSYLITRTWTATDDCGNQAIHTQVLTVRDTKQPVFVEACPNDATVECDDIPPAVALTATDNCDPSPVVILAEDTTSGSSPNDFIITRTWTATDDCGNSTECEQVITVKDTEKPTIVSCPPDISINCDSSTDPAVTGYPVVSDACDPSPAVSYFDGAIVNWSFTRTWTVTDLSGNSRTCQQKITLVDTVKPQMTCPPQLSVQCIDDLPAPNVNLVSVLDNCDPNPVVEFIRDQSDLQNCPKTITRTYRATDNRGNQSECTQVIIIDDTQPPVFTQACPTDITVECDAVPAPAVLTATDNCDSSPSVVPSVTTVPGNCDHQYVIIRTWTATDDCGNQSVCAQNITVRDTKPPLFEQACPADLTVECNAVPVPATLTAHDNCDESPAVTFSENKTPGNSANDYTLTRTWTATDDCGNSAQCQQRITVRDTTPPSLTCPPTFTVDCANQADPVETGMPTVTDNCDGSPQIIFRDKQIGKTITRTWIATDASGNVDSCEQIINANNTVPAALDTLYISTEYGCIGEEYCVSWEPVSGALSYEIRENNGIWEDIGLDAFRCYTQDHASTFAYRVRPKNGCGPAPASMSRVVVVSGKPAKPDTLYASVDTLEVGVPYTVSWDPIGGADAYILYENDVEIYNGLNTDTSLTKLDAQDYKYRIIVCNNCGLCSEISDPLLVAAPVPTAVEEIDSDNLPNSFALGQNYPNPFNPETRIEFNLPRSATVRIEIYNILGELVTTLVNRHLPAGRMAVTWDGRSDDGRSAPSGIYLYRMSAGEFTESRKMILLK